MTQSDQIPPPSPLIRLNRYLAQCGLGSRRHCDTIIAAGKIVVNGTVVSELGTRIDPASAQVSFKGETLSAVRALEYVAYHKPRGEIVTADDPQGRTTVFDSLKRRGLDVSHLRHIGRLDMDSEGLLLLSNDGDLIHAITHPRFHIKKIYEVQCARPLTDQEITRLTIEGIVSEGQTLHAASLGAMPLASPRLRDRPWYEIVLYEGKNRQIRRMLEGVGVEVIRLRRVQFGSVRMGDLVCGAARGLTQREIGGLRASGHDMKKG